MVAFVSQTLEYLVDDLKVPLFGFPHHLLCVSSSELVEVIVNERKVCYDRLRHDYIIHWRGVAPG